MCNISIVQIHTIQIRLTQIRDRLTNFLQISDKPETYLTFILDLFEFRNFATFLHIQKYLLKYFDKHNNDNGCVLKIFVVITNNIHSTCNKHENEL